MRALPEVGIRLGPKYEAVTTAALGHPGAGAGPDRKLDRIPIAVVTGFRLALESSDPDVVHDRLQILDPELLGFGYEGAVMATCLLDGISGGRRTRELVTGPATRHMHLILIGAGFAIAKLPRARRHVALHGIRHLNIEPSLRWLVIDGYGFDLAWFNRRRWLQERRRHAPLRFDGSPDRYLPAVVDQGIGRALWFSHSAQVGTVANSIHEFHPARIPDLWSGVGLAATVAGGASADALYELSRLSGGHHRYLALGSALGAMARAHSGFVPASAHDATGALAGCTVDEANAIVRRAAPATSGPRTESTGAAYLNWRSRICQALHERKAADVEGPLAA